MGEPGGAWGKLGEPGETWAVSGDSGQPQGEPGQGRPRGVWGGLGESGGAWGSLGKLFKQHFKWSSVRNTTQQSFFFSRMPVRTKHFLQVMFFCGFCAQGLLRNFGNPSFRTPHKPIQLYTKSGFVGRDLCFIKHCKSIDILVKPMVVFVFNKYCYC